MSYADNQEVWDAIVAERYANKIALRDLREAIAELAQRVKDLEEKVTWLEAEREKQFK